MRIVLDLFPAKVLVVPTIVAETLDYSTIDYNGSTPQARRVTRTRIVITDEVVMIAADANAGPTLIFKERYDESSLLLEKNRSKPMRVRTRTGKVLVFMKDENCGCGSMLRAWNPYGVMYSDRDPR
jgi:hypothetical protein